MRVDFYQSGQDPVESVVALLALNTLNAGQRLLVVAADPGLLDRIGESLWSAAGKPDEQPFLANGRAGGLHDARQPVLLSDQVAPANGARFVVLADGVWRDEALAEPAFDRVFMVFDDQTVEGARRCWRMLGQHEGMERKFWKQDGKRWVQAA
ncbi:MAG: DNA polymerase III subunit chi [Pseudomonadota bacterium]